MDLEYKIGFIQIPGIPPEMLKDLNHEPIGERFSTTLNKLKQAMDLVYFFDFFYHQQTKINDIGMIASYDGKTNEFKIH